MLQALNSFCFQHPYFRTIQCIAGAQAVHVIEESSRVTLPDRVRQRRHRFPSSPCGENGATGVLRSEEGVGPPPQSCKENNFLVRAANGSWSQDFVCNACACSADVQTQIEQGSSFEQKSRYTQEYPEKLGHFLASLVSAWLQLAFLMVSTMDRCFFADKMACLCGSIFV